MIAIFTDLKEAENLCAKIHEHLSANCPGYNAALWQTPVKAEKVEQYYVQLPEEFEKDFYPVKAEKIAVAIKPITDKSVSMVAKLPDEFKTTPVEEPIKTK